MCALLQTNKQSQVFVGIDAKFQKGRKSLGRGSYIGGSHIYEGERSVYLTEERLSVRTFDICLMVNSSSLLACVH